MVYLVILFPSASFLSASSASASALAAAAAAAITTGSVGSGGRFCLFLFGFGGSLRLSEKKKIG